MNSSRPHVVVGALGLAVAAAVAGCARPGTAATSTPPPLAVSVPGAASSSGGEPATSLAGSGHGVAVLPGRYVLRGSLPTSPTHAAVVTLGSHGPADVTTVGDLADVLGLPAPTRVGDDWVSRSHGSVLRVYGYPGHPWVFARADAAACPPLSLDGFDGPGTTVACGYAVTPGTSGRPRVPADAAVRAAATPVLAAAGLDADMATVGYGAAAVDPVLLGVPTEGVTTRVEVDAKGVRTATGWLLDPRRGTVYRLLPADDVFRQLQREPRPMPACPMTTDGSALGCRVADVVVTGARLGLALGWTAKGPVLVPAWAFTTKGGPVFRVAIATRPVEPAPGAVRPTPGVVPPAPAGGGSAGSPGQAVAATSS